MVSIMGTIRWLAQDVGVVADFMSNEECDQYIQFSEQQGYEEAAVSTELGMVMMKDVRNNDRVIVDDSERAAMLYERVKEFVPIRFKKKWQPVGLNERLRLYRYDIGQQFDWHHDGYYERENGERSFFTFMVYLNDDFEGGGTSFRDEGLSRYRYEGLLVRPRKGMALLFHHPIPHRGDPVLSGRKYVLRSDVMFARRRRD